MQKDIVISTSAEGVMEADIVAIQDWDGFDSLASYLEMQCAALPVEKLDGADSRVWKFQVSGTVISLHNSPDGNYLKAVGHPAHEVLKAIVADLEARLRGEDTSPVDTGAPRTFAGQPCPREGKWFTVADPANQRHFKVGEIMSTVESDYGTIIWQWSGKQQ
ncbi:MAG: hypothetical protein ABI605_21050 [Rhizobacter sp.]